MNLFNKNTLKKLLSCDFTVKINKKDLNSDHFSFLIPLPLKNEVIYTHPTHLENEGADVINFKMDAAKLFLEWRQSNQCQREITEVHPSHEEFGKLISALSLLKAFMQSDSSFTEHKVQNQIKLMICLMAEIILDGTKNQSLSDRKRNNFNKVQDYVIRNLFKQITVKSAADKLGISYQYINELCHFFRNVSFKHFIEIKRMEIARRLLENNDIKFTAKKCGYKNYSNFIQKFKKFYHITPLQFKKMSIKPQNILSFIELPGVPEKLISNNRSKHNHKTFFISNISDKEVDAFWITPKGEEIHMYKLKQGDREIMGTPEGSCWKVGDLYYRTLSANSIIIYNE